MKHKTYKHTCSPDVLAPAAIQDDRQSEGLSHQRCGCLGWGLEGHWTRLMGDICPGCLSVRVKDYGTRGQHRNSAHTQAHKEQTEGGALPP